MSSSRSPWAAVNLIVLAVASYVARPWVRASAALPEGVSVRVPLPHEPAPRSTTSGSSSAVLIRRTAVSPTSDTAYDVPFVSPVMPVPPPLS